LDISRRFNGRIISLRFFLPWIHKSLGFTELCLDS
jgi:hypothetical protein